MIEFYRIDAVHDILKRVIKSNLDKDEMVKLYKELQNAGYEDKNIKLDTTRKIYEAGEQSTDNREILSSNLRVATKFRETEK